MKSSLGHTHSHVLTLICGGGAERQISFHNRPFPTRLTECTQPIEVVERSVVTSLLGTKFDPAMIHVVGNQHSSRAHLCPHSFVLPVHVIRCMKVVVEKDVDARKLIQ